MSDFEDDYQSDEADSRNPLRARMKDLEAEVKALRAERQQFEAERRELTFVKAGIDPADTKVKYFVKGYDGDLNPEAIRSAAIEAGFLSPDPQPETVSEQQAWQRTNQVAAGAGNVQPPSIDDRIRNATSEAEVLAILTEAQQ